MQWYTNRGLEVSGAPEIVGVVYDGGESLQNGGFSVLVVILEWSRANLETKPGSLQDNCQD